MESEKLRIIQELMEQLQDEMAPGEDDFSDRLGRPKPKMEIMKMEAHPDDMGDGEGDDLMDKMMGRSMMASDGDGDEEDPRDAMLKQRLMKLRA